MKQWQCVECDTINSGASRECMACEGTTRVIMGTSGLGSTAPKPPGGIPTRATPTSPRKASPPRKSTRVPPPTRATGPHVASRATAAEFLPPPRFDKSDTPPTGWSAPAGFIDVEPVPRYSAPPSGSPRPKDRMGRWIAFLILLLIVGCFAYGIAGAIGSFR